MSVLVGAVDHGRGFGRPHSGFGVLGCVLGLRTRRRTAALRLQLFVWEVSTELLTGDLPQVLAVKVEGVLTGDVPHHSRVGDLAQPLL